MTRAPLGRILQITLDANSDQPLYRQIYADIRSGILARRLRPGATLPSTRALAADLAIARSTVVVAYEQLRAEGYLECQIGAGTRVSPIPPEEHTRSERPQPNGPRSTTSRPTARRLSSVVRAPNETLRAQPRAPRPFRCAVPAVDIFPIELWTRMVTRALRSMSPRQLSYGETFGHAPLREAVAEYLTVARGVRCTASQVMIVNGSQQAIALCSATLLDPGSEVWVEDPGYFGIRGALHAADARLVPIPVDGEGIDVEYGWRHAPSARAAFVTPARQLPLGMTMTPARRRALLAWAESAGAWVIEDDYDSEFRYTSRPLGALQGLDTGGCVIYTGTFSKVMFPALRLGYVVVPDSVHDAFAAARHFADFHSPYLEQAALAEFIRAGHFERHIRHMRAIYADRQGALVEAAHERLAGRLDVRPMDAGMSLIGWLRREDDEEAVAAAAAESGVEVMPVSRTTLQHRVRPGLILGFSGIGQRDIHEGVGKLADALRRYDRMAERR
jgi:GntR family transcriptional regulator / MocR family aminotransferase